MAALTTLSERHGAGKPLKGVTVGVCLHVTKETSVLIDSLVAAGAEVKLAAANPLSTQDDVAAYLSTNGRGLGLEGPDSQGVRLVHRAGAAGRSPRCSSTTEPTSTSPPTRPRLRASWEAARRPPPGWSGSRPSRRRGKLRYPIIAINNARTKHLFDNRYGTGQSTFDGILRATALLIAGKKVVVVGYGWVGKGVAMRAKGLNANVTVVEIDPIKALEAHLDGFDVMSIEDAARQGRHLHHLHGPEGGHPVLRRSS